MFNATAEPSAGKVAFSAPDRVKAGLVKVSLKNAGKQPHDALLVRVDGNHAQRELIDRLEPGCAAARRAAVAAPLQARELQEVRVG